ncbi:MAG: preprotein translocase subunit SecG [Gammaproteobacteria bacterium]|nr:preprotein translocase subunit SecG [Gammaproteobacteria bacterium]
MQSIILGIHILLAVTLVGLILIQKGKGADFAASFGGGSGASQTVFGSQGSGSFITKSTAIVATLFFVTSLTLAYFTTQGSNQSSVTDSVLSTEPAISVSDLPDVSVNTKTVSDLPDIPVEAPTANELAPANKPSDAPVEKTSTTTVD